jgi:tripartite-type tricarboxylate transporter receptor subunit TctC
VIGVTRRNPVIRAVPTLTEKGQPDISPSTWAELRAPGQTPKPVMDRLAQALEKTMTDPAATLELVERENEVVRAAARKLGLAR